jgi:hypothetical protein
MEESSRKEVEDNSSKKEELLAKQSLATIEEMKSMNQGRSSV